MPLWLFTYHLTISTTLTPEVKVVFAYRLFFSFGVAKRALSLVIKTIWSDSVAKIL